MPSAMVRIISIVAFLLLGLVTGCGRTDNPKIPVVISTTPAAGATGVLVVQIITATFKPVHE